MKKLFGTAAICFAWLIISGCSFSPVPPAPDPTVTTPQATTDTTPPDIQIVWPQDLTAIAKTVTVKIRATDPSGIRTVTVSDGLSLTVVLTQTAGQYFETDLSFPSNGNYQISATAEDGFSNVTSPVVAHVTVDTGLPYVKILSPVDGFCTNQTTLTVSGTASVDAPSVISAVELVLDGGGAVTASGTDSWSRDFPGLTEAAHVLEVRAITSDSRTNSVWATLTVDQTRPVLTFSGTTGLTNRNDVFSLAGTASDSLSGVTNVFVRLNTGAFASRPVPDGNWSNAFSVGTGLQTCSAYAVDRAGNVSDTNDFGWYEAPAWALLIHMAVDNNIDYDFDRVFGIVSNYLATLESVKARDDCTNMEILVMMDCYNSDINTNGYVTHYQDGYYRLRGGSFSADRVVPKTEINSGSLNETKAFFDWAVANFPGKKYFYSVFNHGSGFDDLNESGTYGSVSTLGIGFDDNSSDSLSHRELGQALSYLKGKIGRNISLFFPYACLMGGMELAYEVRDSADRMLFSEELFPAEKWSYETLGVLTTNASITAEDLGKAFCDNANTYFTTVVPREFTLSLVRLDAVSALASALSDYAQRAVAYIGTQPSRASVFNSAALNSFSMYTAYGIPNFYYMDIGDYMNRIIAAGGMDATLQSRAAAVKTALQNCVVYNKSSGYTNATGMTILHNVWYSAYQYPMALYQSILSFGANSWASYVTRVMSLQSAIGADAYEPDDAAFAQAKPITVGAAGQQRTLHTSTDVDYISVYLTAGQTYKVETYALSVDPDTMIALFDSGSNMLAFDNDSGDGYFSKYYYTPAASKTYYIGVASYSYQTGDYQIDVTLSAAPSGDAYEPDNDISSAKSLTLNAAKQVHSIVPAGDNDYLKLDLSAVSPGTQIKIETYASDVGCDTYVYLLDSSGVEITHDDDSGDGFFSRIVFTCNTPGIYYVRTRLYSPTTTGNYQIDAVSGVFADGPAGWETAKDNPFTLIFRQIPKMPSFWTIPSELSK